MSNHPLIDAAELLHLVQARPSASSLVLLDCRFDLTDTVAGEQAYAGGHIPGAQYAHLDRDLAGVKTGRNGRHPLPEREIFARRAGRWGITPGTRVVTYDAQGGPYAARAWWLLNWLGHEAAQVLDGGLDAWRRAGGALEAARPLPHDAGPYPASAAAAMPTLDSAALMAALPARLVLDARQGERFRGESETLDPVAGHIPGARSRFFKDNLQPDGRFKPAATLRHEFEALLGGTAASAVVQQCGSGVTACHNLLAMTLAGLGTTTLYPGSWSEWCSDPSRPIARGG